MVQSADKTTFFKDSSTLSTTSTYCTSIFFLLQTCSATVHYGDVISCAPVFVRTYLYICVLVYMNVCVSVCAYVRVHISAYPSNSCSLRGLVAIIWTVIITTHTNPNLWSTNSDRGYNHLKRSRDLDVFNADQGFILLRFSRRKSNLLFMQPAGKRSAHSVYQAQAVKVTHMPRYYCNGTPLPSSFNWIHICRFTLLLQRFRYNTQKCFPWE